MSLQQMSGIECTYGWGQKARLYQDHLEANGIVYPLSDLMYMEPVYLHLMGISSIRIKLFFKHKMVVLRGLTYSKPVQEMLAYLTRLIGSPTVLSLAFSSDMYALEETSEYNGMTAGYEVTKSLKQLHLSDSSADDPLDPTGTDLLEGYGQLILPEIIYLPEDIESYSAYHLPCIDLPLRLLPGEIAHYRTTATLCDEPDDAISPENSEQCSPIKYRMKDWGTFILTSSRILYLGRKRHMLLDYGQIMHISCWYDIVVLTVKDFQKRQLFEMRHPLECRLYLEALLDRYWATHKTKPWDTSSISSSPLSIPVTSHPSIRTRALARSNTVQMT